MGRGRLIVFDASALIAYFSNEPGAAIAEARLAGGLISTANVAEVITKSADRGQAPEVTLEAIQKLPIIIVPVNTRHARVAGILRPLTKAAGLSLGDRLCLALALVRKKPVLTAEHVWKKLPHGVQVDLIR